ncbi:branched-chain amino acid transporter permease [Luedemannella flava]
MASTTLLLRATPFLALQKAADAPVVRYLGRIMPAGIMVILVIYSLNGIRLTTYPYGLPSLIAVTVTLLIHAWRRNPLLSIVVGTATYMVSLHLFG